MHWEGEVMLSIMVVLLFASCKTDPIPIVSEDDFTYYLDCSENNNYSGESDLANWLMDYNHNDTALYQTFFDTIRYDFDGTINTIGFTWYNDPVGSNFDWNQYIMSEADIIISQYDSVKSGFYEERSLEHYWFSYQKDTIQYYGEYLLTNPLTIRTISSTSSIIDLKSEFCKLIDISFKADELRP